MSDYQSEDRNLALDTVRVTEAAALASARLMGRGDEKAADQAAVDAMRQALNVLDIDGTVVDRRGRARRGADALHRREGRRRLRARRSTSPSTRSRAPRSPPRAAPTRSPASPWRRTAASSTRPTPTWTRSPSARGLPRRLIDLTDAAGREPARGSPRPRALDVEDLVVLILDRPRHQELIAARPRRRARASA